MTKYNAANERMKRHYFAYLREAKGHSEQTVDAAAKAIARYEAYTGYKDFKLFHIEQARAFKRDLASQRGQSGEPLSKATLYATLATLKHFFVWLAGQDSLHADQRLRDESSANFHPDWLGNSVVRRSATRKRRVTSGARGLKANAG